VAGSGRAGGDVIVGGTVEQFGEPPGRLAATRLRHIRQATSEQFLPQPGRRARTGRTAPACNAEFGVGIIAGHTARDGLDPGHLDDEGRRACLMGRRSD
jgi:hypothetical protein